MSQDRKGRNHSEETKYKISIAKKGVPKSENHKRKISNFQKGKIESLETRIKKSLSRTGKKHSSETLEKLSNNSGRAIRVNINGVEYKSLKEAALKLFPENPDIRKVKRLISST